MLNGTEFEHGSRSYGTELEINPDLLVPNKYLRRGATMTRVHNLYQLLALYFYIVTAKYNFQEGLEPKIYYVISDDYFIIHTLKLRDRFIEAFRENRQNIEELNPEFYKNITRNE